MHGQKNIKLYYGTVYRPQNEQSLANAQIILQYSLLPDNIFRDYMVYFRFFAAFKGFIYLFIP
jgi:hypothetical protein